MSGKVQLKAGYIRSKSRISFQNGGYTTFMSGIRGVIRNCEQKLICGQIICNADMRCMEQGGKTKRRF